jgi:TonB family protein
MATPYGGFQLGLLPERKINKRAMAASYGFVTLVVLILINLGVLMPEKLELQTYHVTELIPLPALRPEPEPIKVEPEVRPRLLPTEKIPVLEEPKLVVPRELRREVPQPVEAPKVVVNQFAAPQLKPATGGSRPQLIHTGDFQGSSQTPTVKAPIENVQTGGFGDPNGLPGTGRQGAKLYAASLGSFDAPVGPGLGNGSGGAKGIRGTVASADFGNGVATAPKSSGGGQVQTGGFGSEQVVHQGPKIVPVEAGLTTPVEITFKPLPVYTAEARSLKIEGEVLLEMSFGANGTLQVNRVVKGLGHGLDEAAIAAASKIRFKPALRNGQPVDSAVIVHVVFQMAY